MLHKQTEEDSTITTLTFLAVLLGPLEVGDGVVPEGHKLVLDIGVLDEELEKGVVEDRVHVLLHVRPRFLEGTNSTSGLDSR